MKKNKLILHIGTHKTGTTSIQIALSKARPQLKNKGILYPRTDREPHPNLAKHSSTFSAANSNDDLVAENERAILLNEFKLSKCHTMILSDEGLSINTVNRLKMIEFFKPFKSNFEISIICYVRRQDFLIESLYNQFVKDQSRKESRNVIEFSCSNQIMRFLDYYEILSLWKGIADQVIVRDFDVVKKYLLNCFKADSGISNTNLPNIVTNTSPDMRLIHIMSKLNRYKEKYDAKCFIQAANLIKNKDSNLKFEKYMLGRNERKRIIESCANSNSKLAEEFGIMFSSELPTENFLPIEEPPMDYVLSLIATMSTLKNNISK